MKFKKEYRWLLFLIIPFIAFTFILFMAPLQIVLNAHPIVTQTYNLQKNENSQNQMRSASHLTCDIINFYFGSVNRLMGPYSRKISQEFLKTNVSQVVINNAYLFYQNASESSLRNESMWFASGVSSVDAFTPTQAKIYESYLLNQPRLRLDFGDNEISRTVAGIYNFYDIQNSVTEDLAFYYPTYKEANFSSINYRLDQAIYQSLIQNYQSANITYMIFGNVSKPWLSQKLISLCKLRLNANTTNGFTCIDIDGFKLNQFLLDLNQLHSPNFNSYLLSPMYSSANASILDNITAGNSSAVSVQDQQRILSAITPFSTLAPMTNVAPSSLMLFIRVQTSSYYVFALILWDDIAQSRITFAYYLVQNYITFTEVDVQSFDVVKSSLNILLIPTIILILLSLVVSVIVLRFLMNGLDLDLHKLNERCKFIFDGDLDIDIPDYKGTKDINEVYEEVRIINKLHRYTSKEYFVGHFSNRIFKYNQALQVIKQLNYDTSNLMENIGEAYIYIEQYDKATYFLKECIKCVEKQIDQDYGGLDRMVVCKQEREKIPTAYKEIELVLIRRIWKLVFCLFKYVELQVINVKQLDQQDLTEAEKALKKERLQKETMDYIVKLKKAMYPDFKTYAQSCMLLNFEIKFMMGIKNFEIAKECLFRCSKITQAYCKQYDEITKKLKEKGSKNLYFFRKNKLSGHSRASPYIMEAFFLYTKGLLVTNDPNSKDYNTAIAAYCEALKKSNASQSVNYLLVNEIKRLMATLKLSIENFQTTQLFRQSMPYKTLYYGPMTKEIEPTLYRIARNPAEVECREYMILLDASYYYSAQKQLTDQLKYLRQRSEYLYDKLIKKFDRVSMIQSNSDIGVETICSLTLKESNQRMLKKSLLDMTNFQAFNGRSELITTLQKVIFRVKNLQCQKVIVFFLKYIDSYIDERLYKGKTKHKTKIKKKISETPRMKEENEKNQFIEEIGEGIEDVMSTQGLRNCKLLLICATGDDYYRLISVFGLRDINKRIWSISEGLNKNNNVVYVIDEKHKTDLDRILMSKLANVSDNHVFAL